MDDEPAYVHGDQSGDRSAQVIQIDSGKHVAVVGLCAALCAATLVASGYAVHVAHNAETESRLTQYYLLDPHSRTPDELAAWAKFRLEHEEH